MKLISSSYTKCRAIAFNVKDYQNKLSFICCFVSKIKQSELSFFPLIMFVQDQPIKIQHFLKVNSLLIFQKKFEFQLISVLMK